MFAATPLAILPLPGVNRPILHTCLLDISFPRIDDAGDVEVGADGIKRFVTHPGVGKRTGVNAGHHQRRDQLLQVVGLGKVDPAQWGYHAGFHAGDMEHGG